MSGTQGKNICSCGRTSRLTECTVCREKKKNFVLTRTKVPIACRICGKPYLVSVLKVNHYAKRGGVACRQCRAEIYRTCFAKTRALESIEARKERSRYARSCVKADPSETVRKQWDTIKSDPALYEKNRARLERQCIDGWKNANDETRNRRIKAFLNSKIGRSVGSDNLKRLMIERGLYDGFVSEEVFHGFVPDEINHELKIIIEYYGDVYHCRPSRYKNQYQFLKVIGRTVGEQWARDRRRLGVFYRFGYSVVIVWESDFKVNPDLQIGRIRDEIDKKRKFGGVV